MCLLHMLTRCEEDELCLFRWDGFGRAMQQIANTTQVRHTATAHALWCQVSSIASCKMPTAHRAHLLKMPPLDHALKTDVVVVQVPFMYTMVSLQTLC